MSTYLRRATKEDCDLLFEWVNDTEVRKSAFSTNKISYEEHQKWFFNLLKDDNRVQYIYIYNDEAVGQIRIDIDADIAEIDYSICASKRGMGHGKNMLQLLYNQIRVDFPNVKRLMGKVKSENIASQRTFLDVGYEEKYKAFEISVI